MISSGQKIKPSVIHRNTYDRLSQVERFFADQFVKEGLLSILPDEAKP